jgi:acyl-CoA dehydrogenase
MALAFSRMQAGFDALYSSLRFPLIGWLFRGPVGAWARVNRLSGPPSDSDIQRIASILMTPGAQRDRLTEGVYVATSPDRPTGRLDRAMLASLKAEDASSRLRKAVRKGDIPRGGLEAQLQAAVDQGLLSSQEAADVREAERLREDTIQVDAFPLDEYLKTAHVAN